MAIDSAAKRMSAGGLKPFKKCIIPDGTLGASDRVQIACLYSGITISAAIAVHKRRLYDDYIGQPPDRIYFHDMDEAVRIDS